MKLKPSRCHLSRSSPVPRCGGTAGQGSGPCRKLISPAGGQHGPGVAGAEPDSSRGRTRLVLPAPIPYRRSPDASTSLRRRRPGACPAWPSAGCSKPLTALAQFATVTLAGAAGAGAGACAPGFTGRANLPQRPATAGPAQAGPQGTQAETVHTSRGPELHRAGHSRRPNCPVRRCRVRGALEGRCWCDRLRRSLTVLDLVPAPKDPDVMLAICLQSCLSGGSPSRLI
jgi:hypothetical protein